MKKQEINPRMQSEGAEDLIPYLPSEIMLNILSRIPARTVIRCKCVCKAWRDLLETHEFVKSHLSKSVPGLAVYLRCTKRYRIVEFVDEHRLNIVFSIDLHFLGGEYIVQSSANDLLFVCTPFKDPPDLFVCNPITREYIRLPSPLEPCSLQAIHGFGVSKMSGEYKVVRINLDGVKDCQVYTVGAFLNGNLHWLAYKKEDSSSHDLICCLDLETERFSTFSPPPRGHHYYTSLSVLGDYLCVCDNFYVSWRVRGIDIWLMKEYGDDKSWTKDFHFDTDYGAGAAYYCPLKVFKGGNFLVEFVRNTLLYYYKEHGRETFRHVDLFNGDSSCATIYAPSFLPLKTFALENVSSF